MGHYVESSGSTTLRFLEAFKSSYYVDLSLDQCLALTLPELLRTHLNLGQEVTDALRKVKSPVVPVR
jgi:oxalate decarboxylase